MSPLLQCTAPSLQAYAVVFGLIISINASVSEFPKRQMPGFFTGPYFNDTTPKNIFAEQGGVAFLPCNVMQLGNKFVSWIRSSDSQILTINDLKFIPDERFHSLYVEESKSWTLQITHAHLRDSGIYECQVSTEPKMSIYITLNVVVPKIEILGESDVYVRAGSSINLTCVTTSYAEEPANIYWYKDKAIISETDKTEFNIKLEIFDTNRVVGTLFIRHSNKNHSGNYSCSPTNQKSASVMLHVLNGDHPAAVQPGKASNTLTPQKWLTYFTTSVSLATCIPIRAFVLKPFFLFLNLFFCS